MAKLFIVGFPKNMDETRLVEMFIAYGGVNTVTIVTDKDTGKSKGYGFITMADQQGADRAIEAINGLEIEGREISVRIVEDKKTIVQLPPTEIVRKPYHQRESGPETSKPKRPRKRL
jgi:RNA recognition motif-containing protein